MVTTVAEAGIKKIFCRLTNITQNCVKKESSRIISKIRSLQTLRLIISKRRSLQTLRMIISKGRSLQTLRKITRRITTIYYIYITAEY